MDDIDQIISESLSQDDPSGDEDQTGQLDGAVDGLGEDDNLQGGGDNTESVAADGDVETEADVETEDDQPADPRIAQYRALADARAVERDRELIKLRRENAKLQQSGKDQPDWRARARTDPRGVAEELGISLDSLLSAYSGGDDAGKEQAGLPDDVRQAVEILKKFPDLEKRLQAIPDVERRLQQREQERMAELRAGLDREADQALSEAGESAPLASHLPDAARQLAHRVRASWARMYDEVPPYQQLVPLVEEGLRQSYPKLAKALSSPADPPKGNGKSRKAIAAADQRSGAAGSAPELSTSEWIDALARDVLGKTA